MRNCVLSTGLAKMCECVALSESRVCKNFQVWVLSSKYSMSTSRSQELGCTGSSKKVIAVARTGDLKVMVIGLKKRRPAHWLISPGKNHGACGASGLPSMSGFQLFLSPKYFSTLG